MPNELSKKTYPDGTEVYFRDDTARTDIASINTALTKKVSLVEYKKTTTGTTVTFDSQVENDKEYLISMEAPITATSRRMRLSMVNVTNSVINEVYFGESGFSLSVNDRRITITANGVNYGVCASLIKLS